MVRDFLSQFFYFFLILLFILIIIKLFLVIYRMAIGKWPVSSRFLIKIIDLKMEMKKIGFLIILAIVLTIIKTIIKI